jgi:hypothetical protein
MDQHIVLCLYTLSLQHGWTPLHIASIRGYDVIVRELLARCAAPNLVDKVRQMQQRLFKFFSECNCCTECIFQQHSISMPTGLLLQTQAQPPSSAVPLSSCERGRLQGCEECSCASLPCVAW